MGRAQLPVYWNIRVELVGHVRLLHFAIAQTAPRACRLGRAAVAVRAVLDIPQPTFERSLFYVRNK